MAWADFEDDRLVGIYTATLVSSGHPDVRDDILPLRAEILERLAARKWLVERLTAKLAQARLRCFILGGVIVGMTLVFLATGPLFR